MFHMHTSFDLIEGAEVAQFAEVWARFLQSLQERDLVHGAGPLARRRSDTPLDTDGERRQGFFVVMSFRDRAQADLAYARIAGRSAPADGLHRAVFALVRDPIFSCWEDAAPDARSPEDDPGRRQPAGA